MKISLIVTALVVTVIKISFADLIKSFIILHLYDAPSRDIYVTFSKMILNDSQMINFKRVAYNFYPRVFLIYAKS